MQIKREKAEL